MDFSTLGILVDMAGCPNRCRHCWLGSHRNGQMSVADFESIAHEFKNWRGEDGVGIAHLAFFSWWREPDFRDDYRELWGLEKDLSSQGEARRFELLSTWRLARDETYAPWAAGLGTKVCQITFFGMDENTDWFMHRKGGFHDQLLATERCLEAGIVPRWQLFPSKRSLHELGEFTSLIHRRNLHQRCADLGGQFEIFLGGMSPEGNGYQIEEFRLDAADLQAIPRELIAMSREGLDLLGEPEAQWLQDLITCDAPPNMNVNTPCLAINADFDVYPNLAEPASWWRLGNLKKDGVDAVLRTYRLCQTPAMQANQTIPIARLCEQYGDSQSTRLYRKDDLICRFMHQWGLDYLTGSR